MTSDAPFGAPTSIAGYPSSAVNTSEKFELFTSSIAGYPGVIDVTHCGASVMDNSMYGAGVPYVVKVRPEVGAEHQKGRGL